MTATEIKEQNKAVMSVSFLMEKFNGEKYLHHSQKGENGQGHAVFAVT